MLCTYIMYMYTGNNYASIQITRVRIVVVIIIVIAAIVFIKMAAIRIFKSDRRR